MKKERRKKHNTTLHYYEWTLQPPYSCLSVLRNVRRLTNLLAGDEDKKPDNDEDGHGVVSGLSSVVVDSQSAHQVPDAAA